MTAEHKQHDFHLVDPSPWPLLSAFSALAMFVGLVLTMHGKYFGAPILVLGLLSVVFVLYLWWRDVVREGLEGHHHTNIVRHGLRMGMALFIISEVMFFFVFFWGFFKNQLNPALLFDGENVLESTKALVRASWPPAGIKTFNAWDLPFINTLILLLSGTTVTWAHYSLMHGKNKDVIKALLITVLLGITFTICQAIEYVHAGFCMSGLFDAFVAKFGIHSHVKPSCTISPEHIYPSIFFMATGFHGFHVIIGTIFLAICLIRAKKQQFSPEGHLGFEFAAWYWHFVDVVWIFLFTFVYVLGS